MEKLGRLLGTLLVLSLIVIACKKEDLSDNRKGGDDFSMKSDLSHAKKAKDYKNKDHKETSDDDDRETSCSSNGNSVNHKLTICHNGHNITIDMSAVPHHFKQHSDDLLFSCDPAVGVNYYSLITFLNQLIIDRNFTGKANSQMQQAFAVWYNEYYAVGNWPIVVVVPPPPPVPDPTMAVCKNGVLVNEVYPTAYTDFENGDPLFGCDATTAVYYSDVEGPLLDIIYLSNLDAAASDVMYQAFLIWYSDYYLAGNWPPDEGGAGGGSGGGSTGGNGTGTDTTIVIIN
jgi:hypothetical protein